MSNLLQRGYAFVRDTVTESIAIFLPQPPTPATATATVSQHQLTEFVYLPDPIMVAGP